MPDQHANFATSLVATAPSPATSGASLVVTTGEGSRYAAPPFNASVGPANTVLTPANSEIVRVTARSTDTLTITRAQEGSSARSIVVGDQVFAGATAKTFTDIENIAGGIWLPSDQGFLAWNFDPMLAATLGGPDGTGFYHCVLIPIRSVLAVTKMNVLLGTAAVTPTANRNICALYTSAGALIAYTADQTWATTGLVPMPLGNLQAGQSLTLQPGYVIATIQGVGGTSPAWQRHNEVAVGTTNTANAGLAAAPFRSSATAAQAAGVPPTTLPAVTVNVKNIWVALS